MLWTSVEKAIECRSRYWSDPDPWPTAAQSWPILDLGSPHFKKIYRSPESSPRRIEVTRLLHRLLGHKNQSTTLQLLRLLTSKVFVWFFTERKQNFWGQKPSAPFSMTLDPPNKHTCNILRPWASHMRFRTSSIFWIFCDGSLCSLPSFDGSSWSTTNKHWAVSSLKRILERLLIASLHKSLHKSGRSGFF